MVLSTGVTGCAGQSLGCWLASVCWRPLRPLECPPQAEPEPLRARVCVCFVMETGPLFGQAQLPQVLGDPFGLFQRVCFSALPTIISVIQEGGNLKDWFEGLEIMSVSAK